MTITVSTVVLKDTISLDAPAGNTGEVRSQSRIKVVTVPARSCMPIAHIYICIYTYKHMYIRNMYYSLRTQTPGPGPENRRIEGLNPISRS